MVSEYTVDVAFVTKLTPAQGIWCLTIKSVGLQEVIPISSWMSTLWNTAKAPGDRWFVEAFSLAVIRAWNIRSRDKVLPVLA
jgi:hypothetical protein